jgi:hypothetical protein
MINIIEKNIYKKDLIETLENNFLRFINDKEEIKKCLLAGAAEIEDEWDNYYLNDYKNMEGVAPIDFLNSFEPENMEYFDYYSFNENMNDFILYSSIERYFKSFKGLLVAILHLAGDNSNFKYSINHIIQYYMYENTKIIKRNNKYILLFKNEKHHFEYTLNV